MSIPLTPDRLRAVYECLRQFPPFCRWSLPHGEEIKFEVTRHIDRRGDWSFDGKHIIRVSSACIGRFDPLGGVIAHEMIHVMQKVAGTETKGAEHNAEFRRKAKSICLRFGWDEKLF